VRRRPMGSRIVSGCFLLALFGLFLTPQAKADDVFTYQLGSNTYTWQLPALPSVVVNDGVGFYIPNVPFSTNGVAQPPELFDFFNSSDGGGFDTFNGIEITPLNEFGATLYTGLASAPTFSIGTFHLTNVEGAMGTLKISTAGGSAVPEPSSLLLVVCGLLALLSLTWKDLRFARR
jgi:hypothetical protein